MLFTLATCFSLLGCGLISTPPLSITGDSFHLTRLSPELNKHFNILFQDNFEEARNWQMFEEIVGGSTCYGQGMGKIENSKQVAKSGKSSLKIWSNATQSLKSNHVIGAYKVANRAIAGTIVFETDVYISPSTYLTGQTGPEMSVQITKKTSNGNFRTYIAGLQYQSNAHLSPTSKWAIWSANPEKKQASWNIVTSQRIYGGQWYHIELEFDLIQNRYHHFKVVGKDVNLMKSLRNYSIIPEKKFNYPATWLSVEGENLWSNCGEAGIFQHQIYYDNVQLKQLVFR